MYIVHPCRQDSRRSLVAFYSCWQSIQAPWMAPGSTAYRHIIIKPPFLGDTKSVSLSFYRRMNMPESARTKAFPAYRNEVMRILVTEERWFYFYALLLITNKKAIS